MLDQSSVVRLSLSGSRSFPNMLVRQSELRKILRIALLSALLTLISIVIDISPLGTSIIFKNVSTLILTFAILCSVIVIRERGAAVRTGVEDSGILQVRSIYPVLVVLPGLVVLFRGLRHLIV